MKLTPRLVAQLSKDWLLRKWRRRATAHGVILMYHRVAAPPIDPWKIAVAPDNFAGHLRELTALADVVPLHELPDRLRAGRRTRPVAAVTFDDAYLDNLTDAKPALERYAVPATVFVPTGWVDSPRPIWWDRLTHAILAVERIPPELVLDDQGFRIAWRDPGGYPQDRAAQRARHALHRDLWSQLRTLPDAALHAAMDWLIERLEVDESAIRNVRVMRREELQQLTADGLVQLGSHAVTHPSLPLLDRIDKASQIEDSAEQFRALTGERPALFAYPFGDLDPESVELVRGAGYSLACTTREDLIWQGDDPLLLPRLAIGNWSPAQFRIRMGHYWLA